MIRHVVFPYPSSNSSVRARALHWLERAVAQGIVERAEVRLHGPGFTRRPIERETPTLLLRNASRLTRGARESGILRQASPGVYDLDDGLPWDNGDLPDLGHWWKRPFPRSVVARRSATAADRVIAGNDVIADWASLHCDDVVVIPTCVEPSEYEQRTHWELASSQPVLGWIGSPATELYLFDVADQLVESHRRFGTRLEIVSGPGRTPPSLAPFTTRRPWTPDAAQWICEWDIGLMPLRDGVYERAKCGYKLLQYAASGVPAIGSPVGVNASLLDDMGGLAPEAAEGWVDAIGQIVGESPSARGRRAASGLAVAQRYSYVQWQQQWLAAVGW